MSINGEPQIYRIAEVRAALNCANSTMYRMITRGQITVIDTPIGRRIPAAEVERLLGGRPLHVFDNPDPKRQAMAARARKVKAERKTENARTIAATNELAVFMDEVRRALPRIEAAVIERLDRIEKRIAVKPQQVGLKGRAKHRSIHDGRGRDAAR